MKCNDIKTVDIKIDSSQGLSTKYEIYYCTKELNHAGAHEAKFEIDDTVVEKVNGKNVIKNIKKTIIKTWPREDLSKKKGKSK